MIISGRSKFCTNGVSLMRNLGKINSRSFSVDFPYQLCIKNDAQNDFFNLNANARKYFRISNDLKTKSVTVEEIIY